MSMKKAFDQTIRDLKREVNKKVLKVPSIEQKVLDATSNESWGPHGSLLSDIAQATRNFHEYEMIMSIIWKRISDTGKNWRHVYKALTVLEYLVAHGSEHVIDEIREHAYQISMLSNFQYIDSSGRDQGNNVRRKSQSLVTLVNDKEKIQEAREKAASNRDKYRNTSAVGGMRRPNSYGDIFDDGRGESRYQDAHGRERNGYGDNDRYGPYADSYSQDGERYGRDSDERYSRESNREDDYPGRSRSFDGSQQGPRRSSDKEKDNSNDNDDPHSSRESTNKAKDHPEEASKIERKFSEQNLGAPPSYEEAVGGSRSPAFSERDEETSTASAPIPFSPPANVIQSHKTADPGIPSRHPNQEAESFDEFDPRGSVSAVQGVSSNAEMDFLGSLSDSWSSNPMALVPVSAPATTSHIDTFGTSGGESTFMATHVTTNALNGSFENPFEDSPFKAVPFHDEVPGHPPASMLPSQPTMNNVGQATQNSEFADTFPGLTFNSTVDQKSMHQTEDVLAGILPPLESNFAAPTNNLTPQTQFLQTSQPSQQTGFIAANQPSLPSTNGIGLVQQAQRSLASLPSAAAESFTAPALPLGGGSYNAQSAPAGGVASNMSVPMSSGAVNHQNNNFLSMLPQAAQTNILSSQRVPSSSTGSFPSASQPAPKFETKSTVWADTLGRGLVNLDISGPKTNPLADIGVDFEALNRKEKRMEKPTATPTSTVTMGQAMGSGSGIGRAGASALRPSMNPMMGPGMGMGGMRPTMAYGYGGMNQTPTGYGMGMGINMGMGMNMGMMAQGAQMRPMLPPGSNPSGYNPAVSGASYVPQKPYSGGHR